MPAPLREFACSVHGPFESRARAPRCPYGCTTVYWSPRTPPAIRTNSVTKGMDALQYRVAAEQGLSDMRSKYVGESVADHRLRPPAPDSFGSPQEYMAAVAQGRAPATSVWGSTSQVGLRAPTEHERSQITPTVGTWDSAPLPKVPTNPIVHPDHKSERSTVAQMVKAGGV